MSYPFLNLEKFIEHHRSIVHFYGRKIKWQEHEAFEKGWSDCLDALQKAMAVAKEFEDSVENLQKELK